MARGRLILFVLLMAGTIVFTLRYGARHADPANSVIGFTDADRAIAAAGASDGSRPCRAVTRA